eukprot:TRINITY_DN6011_c0_g1_i1.p1 TRINITY_DN6011_c0_g1~~TRINITY_DN6011_c0_g1_i1.p1  ORF type:complete len:157 (+),score=0.20 TRINITY_DN6011_c0_g1_i1:48-518(+)
MMVLCQMHKRRFRNLNAETFSEKAGVCKALGAKLLQHYTERLVAMAGGSGTHLVTNISFAKIRARICIATLSLGNWRISPTGVSKIASDLNSNESKVLGYFASVGCTTVGGSVTLQAPLRVRRHYDPMAMRGGDVEGAGEDEIMNSKLICFTVLLC